MMTPVEQTELMGEFHRLALGLLLAVETMDWVERHSVEQQETVVRLLRLLIQQPVFTAELEGLEVLVHLVLEAEGD